ncbi:LysR family transcriptional regulator, glycine cleavage system transcriptional activator [Litoreibacter ascidiaceicola]|uniref:LysR family transcriptional regulator, glycine cleavage system transcriptional activator n=1 Tax=Litoreibacter ascidiaceicola TaxID=1486859 RepID=A0A1M5AY18_9RHOB|nr:LysR family transcriptional regulator [Litoreibacter ascidiaceicola]SHF35046.1 LysR family transcriptional regulator, glycine cleavage system transcriptional activator [Litoreibacter ascidiaceicola]
MNWRDIPSLSALKAFEATARLGSFSAAARELNVTHAAIAQHVRGLEAEFGAELAFREGTGMALTEAGRALSLSLGEGFGTIASGVRDIRALKQNQPLKVSLTATFAENWLMPRIGAFWAEHPDIEVALQPSNAVVDMRRDGFDLAIRYGHGEWAGLEAELLVHANYVVVACPELAAKTNDTSMLGLCSLPWVFEAGRMEQRVWAEEVGLDLSCTTSIDLPTNSLVLSATRGGAGLSIQTRAMVEGDLQRGTLVCLQEAPVSTLGYYLATRPVPRSDALKTFIRWLKSAAA